MFTLIRDWRFRAHTSARASSKDHTSSRVKTCQDPLIYTHMQPSGLGEEVAVHAGEAAFAGGLVLHQRIYIANLSDSTCRAVIAQIQVRLSRVE